MWFYHHFQMVIRFSKATHLVAAVMTICCFHIHLSFRVAKKDQQARESRNHTSAGYREFFTRYARSSGTGKSPSSLWFPWQPRGGLYRLHLRIGKVNLHAFGRPPASRKKEHFERLPALEEERGCQACLMLAVCTWQDLPFPRIPHSGSPPAT